MRTAHIFHHVIDNRFLHSGDVTRRPSWMALCAAIPALLTLALTSSIPAKTASAATFTWNGGGGNVNWSTSGNWTGGVPTSNVATDIIFAGTINIGTSGTPLNQNIATPFLFNSITFNSTAGSFFIGGSDIGVNGSRTVTQSSASAQDINNNFVHNGANSTQTLNLAGNGAGLVTFDGQILRSSSNRDIAVVKTGTSTFRLNGNSDYDGTTTISAGTIIIGHDNALGDVTGGTSVASGAALQIQGGIAVGAEGLTLNGNGVSSGGNLRNISGNNSWAGGILLNKNSRINSDAGTLTLSGGINDNDNDNVTFGGSGNIVVQTTGITTGDGNLTKDGSGTLSLNVASTFKGGTNANGGTLIVGHANALGTSGTITVASSATLAVNTGVTFTRSLTLNSNAILAGKGTYTPGGTFTVGSGVRVAPGINDIGTFTIGNNTTFGGNSILDIEVNGASTDLLKVTGTLNNSNSNSKLALSMTSPTLGKYKIADFTVNINSGSNPASNGGFGSVTGLNSAYRLAVVTGANGEIDLIRKATIGTITVTPAASSVITGGTTTFGFTVQNSAPVNSDSLSPTFSAGSNVTGSASSGSIAANSTSSTINGFSFNSTSAGIGAGRTGSFTVTDASATNSPQTGTVTVDVYDHASGSVGGTTLTIPDVILGYASAVASSNSISVNNASGFRVNLKTTNNGPLNSISLNNVSAVAAGGSGSLTGSLATGKAAGNYSQGFTLTYADDSALAGASSSLGTQAITVNGNVYNHASGSLVGGSILTIPDVILGYSSPVASSNSLTFSNASGFRVNLKTTNNGPQNSLSITDISALLPNTNGNITGSLATGKGVGNYSQGLTVTYADDSALSGASSSLGTQGITLTGNVYDHASGSVGGTTLTIPDVIVGYSSAVASSNSINVSNASGFRVNLKTTNNGPLNSISLNNVSAVAAGGSGSLTGSLATGKAAGNYSQGFTLTYADDSALAGASSSLGTQAITVNGNVLNHSSPSLSTTTVNFGNVLQGASIGSVSVDLQNAAGPFRADLVLTGVNGTGDASTLTRSGSSSGSIAAGGSLSNSIGLVTTTAGSFNANYAYDVEDQNLAGGLDQATQNLAVSGNVYAAASITANTATTLNSGSSVLINNAAAAPLRATAYVDTYSISPGWTLNNLGVGSTIAPGAGAPTANVSFDDTGLLNNYVVTGTLLIMLENDQAITGTTNQDLGSYNWNLSHTVSGQTGIQAAPVAVNGAYDNLAGTSDKLLASIATLLDGDNVNGPATSVTMIWRDRVGAELPSGSPRPLVSDVADLDGTAGDVFVLQMNYDQGQASTEAASAAAGSLFLAWFDGSDWVNAIQGNVGTNTTNPAFLNYQGSWASSGAGLTLGAWGVDIANDVVWAVLDHNSEFAVEADVVPEPSTIVLVIAGIGMLVGACRCGRLNQRFGA